MITMRDKYIFFIIFPPIRNLEIKCLGKRNGILLNVLNFFNNIINPVISKNGEVVGVEYNFFFWRF